MGFEDQIGKSTSSQRSRLSRGLGRSKEWSVQAVEQDTVEGRPWQCRKRVESHKKETRHQVKVQRHRDRLWQSEGDQISLHNWGKNSEANTWNTLEKYKMGSCLGSYCMSQECQLLLRSMWWFHQLLHTLCYRSLGLVEKSSPNHFRHATSPNEKTKRKHFSVIVHKWTT